MARPLDVARQRDGFADAQILVQIESRKTLEVRVEAFLDLRDDIVLQLHGLDLGVPLEQLRTDGFQLIVVQKYQLEVDVVGEYVVVEPLDLIVHHFDFFDVHQVAERAFVHLLHLVVIQAQDFEVFKAHHAVLPDGLQVRVFHQHQRDFLVEISRVEVLEASAGDNHNLLHVHKLLENTFRQIHELRLTYLHPHNIRFSLVGFILCHHGNLKVALLRRYISQLATVSVIFIVERSAVVSRFITGHDEAKNGKLITKSHAELRLLLLSALIIISH